MNKIYIKDSEHVAAMVDTVQSVDNLDFVMESDAVGHTVMDKYRDMNVWLLLLKQLRLKRSTQLVQRCLSLYLTLENLLHHFLQQLLRVLQKKVHIYGISGTEFKISPVEITMAIIEGLKVPIEAEPELEVPKELISSSHLQELRLQRAPSFVPLSEGVNSPIVYDKETGITQCCLSNGIPVNYKITQHESKAGVMRLIVGGGRATEDSDPRGAVIVGVRNLSEGGRVGNLSREQVELFCVNHLINCSLESTEEFICMEFRFTRRDGGMRAVFQLLHMVLENGDEHFVSLHPIRCKN